VLVPMHAGRPFEFRKRWQGEADAVGESIGFFKLAPGHVPTLIAATRIRTHGVRRAESYDEIIRDLVVTDCFGAEDVSGEQWTEIDFPEDIDRARQVVMPTLADD